MKITKYLFILTAFIAAGIQSVYAQSTDSEHKGLLWSSLHGLDYEFKAGVNIGGTSPLPLPQEIRSLDSYSPGLAITLEGSATKWIDVQKKWGVSIGFRLDKKDMTTDATVKNYGMAIFNEVGGKVEGLYRGSKYQSKNVITYFSNISQISNKQTLETIGRSLFLLYDGWRILR